MTILDTFDIEHDGATYRADVIHDEHMGHPWDEHDGHGAVEYRRKGYSDHVTKAPGEMILAEDCHGAWLYDFAATVQIARRDGWDAAPYGQGTAKQRAARAAAANFEHLRRYLNDDWGWVGVRLTPLCACCGEPDDSRAASLWGIESNSGDYLRQVAEDLIAEVEPATADA